MEMADPFMRLPCWCECFDLMGKQPEGCDYQSPEF